ncbi:MAG: CopG family transcriptional regulator [Thermoguttaceae bacterium]|jgi:hypothetical protein
MVRTQIQLTEEQYRRLKKSSAERDMPIAEQIREAVDIYLQRQEQSPQRSFAQIAGKFMPKTHVGAKTQSHDDWFADSIAQRKAGRS